MGSCGLLGQLSLVLGERLEMGFKLDAGRTSG
jgi:hypothetical protein